MSLSPSAQRRVLSDQFSARREAILKAWGKADRSDPDQTTGRTLTRGQFHDHIPEILDAFEQRLRSRPGGLSARAADSNKQNEEVKHGLHRWQQGYRLKELIKECGHLQMCLSIELGRIAEDHPEIEAETLAKAQRQIMALINDTIRESAGQYERMQQAEAASHVGDLRGALASLNEIEQSRSALFHQAVHDLKNDVLGVDLAVAQLGKPVMADTERVRSACFLQKAVQGLHTMMEELMQLARLQAGQETRKIAAFDAGALMSELGEAHQPFARERRLRLHVEGPPGLRVQGDAEKTRRLAKNLLGNALKFTSHGEVWLSWGKEKASWWLIVKDTGPGLLSGTGSPIVTGLQEATASAKESDDKVSVKTGEASQVLKAPWDEDSDAAPALHQAGEGIGLSIVKRLCELLDASIEIASSAETGTTFRVVFPLVIRSRGGSRLPRKSLPKEGTSQGTK